MSRAEEGGEAVYLHCTYGAGRSPTFAMAYLIHRGYSAAEAIEFVKHRHSNTWMPGSPVEKYTDVLESFEDIEKRQGSKVERTQQSPSLSTRRGTLTELS